MIKKVLVALILAAFAVGGVFAQADEQADVETDVLADAQGEEPMDEQNVAQANEPYDFATRPKNTITVDLGPTVIGAIFGAAGNIIGADEINTSGSFGIGAQYERQLFPKMSVGARFAYLGFGLGYSYEEEDSTSQQGGSGTATLTTDLGVRFSSLSLEGHARFYPFGETFFLDGMLGFANFKTSFSGHIVGEVTGSGGGMSVNRKEEVDISFDASRNYFKAGAKLGWRITFGKRKQGGFVFEPAFGYYVGASGGDTFGTQLTKGITSAFEKEGMDTDNELDDMVDTLDVAFGYLEKFIFVGGPRFTLNFGWRF